MKALVILAFVWFSGQSPLNFSVSRHADPVVEIAADMMQDDLEEVTGVMVRLAEVSDIAHMPVGTVIDGAVRPERLQR